MINLWNILLIILLLNSKSIQVESLEPDRPNAEPLNEYERKCKPNGKSTFKITNNQNKKYFHLIKDIIIEDFEL